MREGRGLLTTVNGKKNNRIGKMLQSGVGKSIKQTDNQTGLDIFGLKIYQKPTANISVPIEGKA